MGKAIVCLHLLIILSESLSSVSATETHVNIKIEKRGNGFTVNLSLLAMADNVITIDFEKNTDKIFSKDFSFQLLDQSTPGAPYGKLMEGKEVHQNVYVNEQMFAAVVILEIEAGTFILSGIIGDMVISYVYRKEGHYFVSSTLEEYNPKRSFQEFNQYFHLQDYSFPKAEVRLLVILDTPLYQTLLKRYPTENSMKLYLSIVLNAVKMRLSITTRNSIDLVISRVIALEDSNLFPESNVSRTSLNGVQVVPIYKATETLFTVATWLLEKHREGNHNLATFLTDRVLEDDGDVGTGYAYTNGAGLLKTMEGHPLYMGATIAHHKGCLDSLHELVHEVMHTFGCVHQYDDENALMAEGSKRTSVAFSLCDKNVNIVKDFLKSQAAQHFMASA